MSPVQDEDAVAGSPMRDDDDFSDLAGGGPIDEPRTRGPAPIGGAPMGGPRSRASAPMGGAPTGGPSSRAPSGPGAGAPSQPPRRPSSTPPSRAASEPPPPAAPHAAEPVAKQLAHTVERKVDAPAKEAERDAPKNQLLESDAREQAPALGRKKRSATLTGAGSAGPSSTDPTVPSGAYPSSFGAPSQDDGMANIDPSALGMQRAELKTPAPMRKKSPMLWIVLAALLALIALLLWWLA